jgi:hypothetical protein
MLLGSSASYEGVEAPGGTETTYTDGGITYNPVGYISNLADTVFKDYVPTVDSITLVTITVPINIPVLPLSNYGARAYILLF